MTDKPTALLVDCNWQPKSIEHLENNFSLISRYSKVDVLFCSYNTNKQDLKYLIDRNSPLIVASNTTSREHIDEDLCKEHDVRIVTLNSTDKGMELITPTVEHTWGLIHALHRRLITRQHQVLSGNWDRHQGYVPPKMLSNMTLLVIGMGRIGSKVAKVASAFGMTVLDWEKTVIDLGQADIVSLHCPMLPETHHMVSKSFIGNMKEGSLLINTARGQLIDEEALLNALQDNIIGGAALDVLQGEPDMIGNPLIAYAQKNDNLILTPHVGGSTLDAWAATERLIIDKALTELKKLPPTAPVPVDLSQLSQDVVEEAKKYLFSKPIFPSPSGLDNLRRAINKLDSYTEKSND